MKRFGLFLLGLTPTIISLLMSLGLAFGLSGVLSAGLALFGDLDRIRDYRDLFMSSDFNALIMLIYSLFAIILFGCWYYARLDGNFRPNPIITFHPYQTLGIVIFVPGAQVATSIIIMVIYSFAPGAIEIYEDMMNSAGMSDHISLLMFFYAVLLGPISEELIFRGVTLQIYRRILPFWAANFMQALLFGIFHMNFVQGCYAFVLGLVLGYVCHRGKSIYLSILMHILFNFWGTYASLLFDLLPENGLTDIAIFGMGIVSLLLGVRLFRKGTLRKAERMDRLVQLRKRCIHLSN